MLEAREHAEEGLALEGVVAEKDFLLVAANFVCDLRGVELVSQYGLMVDADL